MPRSFLITNKRYKADYLHAQECYAEAYKENASVLGSSISVVVGVHSVDIQQHPVDLRRDMDTDDSMSGASLPSSGDESYSSETEGGSPTSKVPSPLHQFAVIAERNAELCGYFGAASLGTHHHHHHVPLDYKLRLAELTHGPPSALSPIVEDLSHHRLDYNMNDLVDKAWDDMDVGDNHVCPDCGKRYSTSSNLARHRQTHRSVSDKKARKCPHCEKVYVSMPAYSMHVRTHNQGCECSFCGKRFSRPWLLQGHIRTHTGEKPFKCPTCTKSFADKSNLRAHVQTHSPEKPYVCGRCGKAFALKSYLYKHEESSCMRGQRYHRNH